MVDLEVQEFDVVDLEVQELEVLVEQEYADRFRVRQCLVRPLEVVLK